MPLTGDFKGKNLAPLTRAISFANGAGVSIDTLAGNVTLTTASANFLAFDPDGSHRDVTFPDTKGHSMVWEVYNWAGGAENLVLKDPAGNTLLTVNQNESARVMTNGSTWKAFMIAISLT